jgi:NADPH-dependent glutamate synthase beta subunit-like oxidoreductase
MHDNTQHKTTNAVAGKNIAIVGGGPGGLTLPDCCNRVARKLWCTSEIKAAAHACRAAR